MTLLDTTSARPIPEGCELDLRIAGPMCRAAAWLFDALLRLVLLVAVAEATFILGDAGLGVFLVAAFLIEWLLPVGFEVLWLGQTPGKRIFGLTVVHDDGTPVGWGASLARNTLRFVDFLPLFYATGFVAMLLNRDAKRLGDLVAGTVVVHLARAEPATFEYSDAPIAVPPYPLTIDEQRAIVEFARRAPQLTRERAGELARLAEPLVGDLEPAAAVGRLAGVARFLSGT